MSDGKRTVTRPDVVRGLPPRFRSSVLASFILASFLLCDPKYQIGSCARPGRFRCAEDEHFRWAIDNTAQVIHDQCPCRGKCREHGMSKQSALHGEPPSGLWPRPNRPKSRVEPAPVHTGSAPYGCAAPSNNEHPTLRVCSCRTYPRRFAPWLWRTGATAPAVPVHREYRCTMSYLDGFVSPLPCTLQPCALRV